MLRDEAADVEITRRIFLATLTAGLAASAPAVCGAAAQEELHVLNSGNLERLRLDFNSSRERVRLLALLSPT